MVARGALITLIWSFTLIVFSCKGPEQAAPAPEPAINEPTTSTNSSFDTMLSIMADPERPTSNVRLPNFYPGQLCHWVRNIAEDPQGNLWIGTNHFGVMRYDGGTLQYFTEDDGFGGNRVLAMVVDLNGTVWFATNGGLTKYDKQGFTTYTTKDGLVADDIWSMLLDDEGLLWLGTANGLSRFDGSTFSTIEYPVPPVTEPEIMLAPLRVTSLLQDKQSRIWIATDGQGITILDNDSHSYLTEDDGLADNSVADLLIDDKGNVWIGTMFGGISRFDGKSFINYTLEGQIAGEEVYALYQDTDGSIWFGAEGEGVYRYDGTDFRVYNEEDQLLGLGIQGIFRDSKDRFWFGGWKGLFRMKDDKFETVTRNGQWD